MRSFTRRDCFRPARPSIEVLEDRCLLSGVVTLYPTPLSDYSGPDQLAVGSDGNFWYTEMAGSNVGRMTPAGAVTEFPTHALFTRCITAGPDGNVWFTEASNGHGVNYIGRVTPAGAVTEFQVPTLDCNALHITTGPDGNLWFTEETGNQLGRITPAGVITEYPLAADTIPEGITTGPDGNLWFGEFGPDSIGRVNPANPAAVTSFRTGQDSPPIAITAGSDGALWFTLGGSNNIGRMTTTGAVTVFTIPTTIVALHGITAGPDGAVWFTESFSNQIGRVTPAGVFTEYPLPKYNGLSAVPSGITAGPNGTVLFTEEYGNQLGSVTTSRTDHYLQALFQDDLGRAPTAVETSAWSAYLVTQGAPSAVLSIGRSPEALTHLVDGLYLRYLGRAADPAGETGAVAYLQRGGTREGLVAALVGSAEYFKRVTAGSANPPASYIGALYRDLLGRTASAAETAAWENILAASGQAAVAADLVNALEAREHVIASYYANILDRPSAPSPAELAAWAGVPLDLYNLELVFETTAEYVANG
jgi:virginiamycin B lyase